MHPRELLKTIYLGDRGCKKVIIDGWGERVLVEVNLISRVRSLSGNWEFYSAEDIVDGLLVFSGVRSIRFDPPGLVPNDYIDSLSVVDAIVEDSEIAAPSYLFTITVVGVDAQGVVGMVAIEIHAKCIHLEDPRRPGVEIR